MKNLFESMKTGLMVIAGMALIASLWCGLSMADDLPTINPSNVPGNVTITYDKANPADSVNTKMIINAPDKTIMNFSSFDISNNYSVQVVLPTYDNGTLASFLARDNSGTFSSINGSLNCNGLFILTNTNGINIGSTAQINVGSLVLSTRDITDSNFISANYIFEKQLEQQTDRLLLNKGTISVSRGGFGVLIAGAIENQGVIVCPMGTIALAGGDYVKLDISANKMISIAIDKAAASTIYDYNGNPITNQINNTGTLEANGGNIILKAESLPDVFEKAINLEGYVKADRLEEKDGVISIVASGRVAVNADISASEKISIEASRISANTLLSPKVDIYKTQGNITVSNSQKVGDLITIEGDGLKVSYLVTSDFTLKSDNTIDSTPGAILQGNSLTLIARKFGNDVTPLTIDADKTNITRITGDIDILESTGLGTSIMITGPPDGFGKIIYSKNTDLSLTAGRISVSTPANSPLEAKNLAIYAYGDSVLKNIIGVKSLILSHSEGANPVYTLASDISLVDLTVDGSTLNGAGYTLTISGNWTIVNDGLFQAGTSTVVFNNADKVSYITGNNTFNNLTITTPGKALVFEAGTMTTISGILTIEGALDNNVSLSSSKTGEGNEFKIWIYEVRDGQNNPYLDYITVNDSIAYGPLIPIPAKHDKIVDRNRNNTDWDATYTAAATGDWSNVATWGGGGYPVAGDTVNIGTYIVYLDAAAAATTLNINSGGTLRCYSQTSVANTLTISGNVTINTGGTITATTGTINVGGNWDSSAGTFTAGTSTINMTGATASIKTAGTGAPLNNVTCTTAGQTVSLLGNIAIAGTFTVGSGASGNRVTMSGGGYLAYLKNATTPITFNGAYAANPTDSGYNISSFGIAFWPGTTANIPSGTYGTVYFYPSASLTMTFQGNVTTGYVRIYPQGTSQTVTLDTGGYSFTNTGVEIGASGVTNKYSTLKVNNSVVDVNGNITIYPSDASGANQINATGTSSWTVSGNITNNDTFTAGTSTVTFDGTASQQIITSTTTVNNTFWNLIFNNGTNTNTLTLNPTSGTPTLDVDGLLTITKGTISPGAYNMTIGGGLTFTGPTNGLLTRGAGTLTFDGTGSWTDSRTTKADLGTITINGTAARLTLGSSVMATNITVGADDFLNLGTGSHTLTLTGTGTPLTASSTSFEKGTGSTVLYTGTTTATTIAAVAYNNLTLTPTAATTYSLANHLSADLSPSTAMSGDLTIGPNATLTTTASNYNIALAGNWTNTGVFTAGTGTVTFNGTTTGHTINPGASSFYNLIFSGSGGAWSPLTNTVTVTNDLTMTAGTFDTSSGTANVTVNGSVAGTAGIINMTTTNTFTQNVAANKNFGATSGSTAWTFYNLTFSSSSGTPTITTQTGGSGSITVAQTLTISANTTLDAGNRTWILSGAIASPFSYSGTLTPAASTFQYTNVNGGSNVNVTTAPYNNLQFTPASAETYDMTGNLTVANALTGNLTIDANATFDPKTYNLTVTGAFSNSGNFGITGTKPSGVHTFSGTWTNASGATFYLSSNVTDTIISGNIDCDGTLNATSNGSLTVNGATIDFINGAYTKGTGTLKFRRGAAQSFWPDSSDFGNVQVQLSTGFIATDVTMARTATMDNLTIDVGNTFELTAAAVACVLNINDTKTIANNGTFKIASSTYGVTLRAASGTANFGTGPTPGSDIDYNGKSVTLSGLTYYPAVALGTGGTNDESITLSGAVTFAGTIALDGLTAAGTYITTGANTLTVQDAIDNIKGTITVSSGGAIAAGANTITNWTDGTIANSGSITCGDFATVGTYSNPAVNTISSSGNVTITSFGGTVTNNTLTMTGGTVLGDAKTIDASVAIGHLTISGYVKPSTNTLQVGGDLVISATKTLDNSTANLGINVAGNWTNSGTYIKGTETVTFNGTSSQQIITSTTTVNNTFKNLTFNNGTNTNTLTLNPTSGTPTLDVDGLLTITKGTVSPGAYNMTIGGGLSFSDTTNGILTRGAGTLTFDGTGSWTDSRTTKVSLGTIIVGGASATLTLGSSVKADVITINITDILNLASSSYTLELAGTGATATVLTVTGTLTPGTSTVKYTAINSGGNVNVTTTTYNSLQFTPASAETYAMTGSLTTTNAMTGNLTISANATLTTTASNYNITLAGNWDSSAGAFTYGTSTVNLTGPAPSINTGGSNKYLYNLSCITSGQTVTLLSNIDLIGTFTVGSTSGNKVTMSGGGYLTYLRNATTPIAFNGSYRIVSDTTNPGYNIDSQSVAFYPAAAGNIPAGTYGGVYFYPNGSYTLTMQGAVTTGYAYIYPAGASQTATLDTGGYSFTNTGIAVGVSGITNRYSTLIVNNSVVDVNGSITIYPSDASGANQINATGTSSWTVSGNWTNNDTFTAGSSTVTFDGSAAQTITGANTWYNLTIANTYATPSDTYDVDPDAVQTVTNTLTVSDGQWTPYTGDIYKDVSIGAAGIMKPDASAGISVSGSWANSGTFTCGTSTVTFNAGATGKTINTGGTGTGKDFYNLTFNNASGGWTMSSNLSVTYDLNVTNGVLNMSTYGLHVGHTAVVADYLTNPGRLVFSSWQSAQDSADSRYWAFYYSGTDIEYGYSATYGTWTTSTGKLSYNTSEFSVVQTAASSAYVAINKTSAYNIVVRKGTFGATDITFAAEQAVFPSASATNSYSMPVIALDGSNYIWVGALRHQPGLYYRVNMIQSTNASDPSAWGTQTAVGGYVASMSDRLILTKGTYPAMDLTIPDESSNITMYNYNGTSWTYSSGSEYGWFPFPANDLDGNVYAVVVMGSDIYIGGSFTSAGGVAVNRIAKYTPGNSENLRWAALNTGTVGVNGDVRAIVVNGTDLYVGGYFSNAGGVTGVNGIAKYTPATSTWAAMGLDAVKGIYKANGQCVNALAMVGTDLYVGGNFSHFGGSGGTLVNNIVKYATGTNTFSVLNTGTAGVDNVVYAMAYVGSDLYVGGSFINAGGASANRIAKYTPATSTWAALGSGVDNAVLAMASPLSDILYVGGDFNVANGVTTVNKIAKYTPSTSTWSAIGTGANGAVYALAVSGSDLLYAGGDFTTMNDVAINYIAKYIPSTTTWSALSGTTGLNLGVRALALFSSDKLYVGGMFTKADSDLIEFIALYTPSTTAWSTLTSGNTGVNGIIYAMISMGSDLYVGGKFTSAGGVVVNNIAKYTPSTESWAALGSGVDNTVYALAVAPNGTDLYVGGYFLYSGSTELNRIAKYTPGTSTWSALNTGTIGVDSYVRALAVVSSDLYVGGSFTKAGGTTVNCIAKYTPATSTWSTMGSGTYGVYNATSPYVFSLAVSGTDLYVGGNFSHFGGSGGTLVNNIVKYTTGTNTFSALSVGVNNVVYAMTFIGSDNLYVGGSFTKLSDNTVVNRIAKYTISSSSWSALTDASGTGVNNIVRAISVMSSVLYVGGDFTYVGTTGLLVNRAAKYTPATSTWSALNIGANISANNAVYALAVKSTDLYAGGSFNQMKQFKSGHFAKYGLCVAAGAGSPVVSIVSDSSQNLHILYWDISRNTMSYTTFYRATAMWSTATILASGVFNRASLSLDSAGKLNAYWGGLDSSYSAIGTIMPDGTTWLTYEKNFTA